MYLNKPFSKALRPFEDFRFVFVPHDVSSRIPLLFPSVLTHDCRVHPVPCLPQSDCSHSISLIGKNSGAGQIIT